MRFFIYGVSAVVIIGCLIKAGVGLKDYVTPGNTTPGISPFVFFMIAVLIFLGVMGKLHADRESRDPDSRYLTIDRPTKD